MALSEQQRQEIRENIVIKYDKRFRETGSFYIEVAEKSHPENLQWIPSGIYRDDSTWLYIIGGYEGVYMFSKRHLQELAKDRSYKHVETGTSKGFLLPVKEALDKWVIEVLYDSRTKEVTSQ